MSRLSRQTTAFSLVEVTLALGIMAFCLVAIFGLLPTGLNTSRDAIAQTVAANIAGAIGADLRQAPAATTATPIPQSLRYLLSVRLLMTWPALADPNGGTLPQKANSAFETMIALDRN